MSLKVSANTYALCCEQFVTRICGCKSLERLLQPMSIDSVFVENVCDLGGRDKEDLMSVVTCYERTTNPSKDYSPFRSDHEHMSAVVFTPDVWECCERCGRELLATEERFHAQTLLSVDLPSVWVPIIVCENCERKTNF